MLPPQKMDQPDLRNVVSLVLGGDQLAINFHTVVKNIANLKQRLFAEYL
jgi:hypothetical protein